MATFDDAVKPLNRHWLREIDAWFREYVDAGLLGDDPLPAPDGLTHPTIARVEVAGELDVHEVENRGVGHFIARCRAPLVVELDPTDASDGRRVELELTLAIEWLKRRVTSHRVDCAGGGHPGTDRHSTNATWKGE